jgi:mannose-6-phosphate isomerase-like protein (cupin superfamily)
MIPTVNKGRVEIPQEMPPDAVKKAWGWYRQLHADDKCVVRLLFIKRGGYCSQHWHERKFNTFEVIAGNLRIECRAHPDLDRFICEAFELTPHSRARCIEPGRFHNFEALTDVLCYEITRALDEEIVEESDIHRLTESGCEGDQ